MALDLRKWLLEDIGVAADQIDAVLPVLTPATQKIEEGFLRQSDYSRHMSAINVEQKKLKDANDALNEEMAEWAVTQQAGVPITAKMRKDLEDAQAKVTRLTTRITTLATQHGIDVTAALDGLDPPTPPNQPNPNQPPPTDLTGLVKLDDFNNRMGGFADYFMTLPADLQVIAQEHFELTGERLNPREIVAEIKDRVAYNSKPANRHAMKPVDATAIWTEKYGIEAKRTAKAAEAHAAEIKAAEDRGAERVRTEMAIPGAHPPAHGRSHSPVLHSGRESKVQRPGGMAIRQDTISRAATAFRTRKYATEGGRGKPAA